MTEDRAKRKLTAILSADIKGYSRLMGEDELATVRTLEDYRTVMAEVIRPHAFKIKEEPFSAPFRQDRMLCHALLSLF